MFSFRTTPVGEQLDRALVDGRVGVFCTQNCWDTENRRYLYDLFRQRGNLEKVFTPRDTELTPLTNHIEFTREEIEPLNAIVVEIQDVGSRYFNYTKDVFALMEMLKEMENPPSMYIIDHVNPAGRVVEGTMPGIADDLAVDKSGDKPNALAADKAGDKPDGQVGGKGALPPGQELHVPKVAHRHGLTLGELANLYLAEIGGKFPLHVISAMATDTSRQFMPWTIAPASDIPGFFTCDLYSGGGLWNNTNLSSGIGTARPYEYIGAPFLNSEIVSRLPEADGCVLRPCSFTPACGTYAGQKCYGFQILLEPELSYHSFQHTIHLMRSLAEVCPDFRLGEGFRQKLSDDFLLNSILGRHTWEETREHIKVEEQKWIRKAKKFLLYEDQPYRIK